MRNRSIACLTQEKTSVIVIPVGVYHRHLELSVILPDPLVRLVSQLETNITIKEPVTPGGEGTILLHLEIIDHSDNDHLATSQTKVVARS